MDSLNAIRERINIFLYHSKTKVLLTARVLNLLVTGLALLALVYFYGYPQTADARATLLNIIQASFAYYIFYYLLQIVYTWSPAKFVSENKPETYLILLLIVEGLSFQLTGNLLGANVLKNLGFTYDRGLIDGVIQLYLFLLIILGLSKSSSNLPKIKFEPSTLFVAGFLIITSVGTLLLSMPEMHNFEQGMPFIDATFTAVSAGCVTGLSTLNIGEDLTQKGQWVVLILMKLGALNIVSYGSMFAFFSKFGIGVKQHEIMEDIVNKYNSISPSGMIRKFFIWSTTIELAGAGLIFLTVEPQSVNSNSTAEHFFFSLFHSISAFTHGGFSLMSSGLYAEVVRFNYAFQWVVILLMFAGGIGLLAVFDLIDLRKIKRFGFNFKGRALGTLIAFKFYFILLIIGTLAVLLLEWNSLNSVYHYFGSITQSIFTSITMRSAGLNTLDTGSFGPPLLLIILFMMFIGGSTGSTAGGIKTSTFAILYANIVKTIRSKEHSEIFKRTISVADVNRAFSIVFFYVAGILLAVFLLSITEAELIKQSKNGLLDIIFEEVSAFATCGLSTGVTSQFSTAGKTVLILSMFIGRVGTLTVVFAFTRQIKSKKYKYPEEHFIIG
ncbi:MAG: TrkH family potassium uptake protein [Luteibaculaceae bacterium]